LALSLAQFQPSPCRARTSRKTPAARRNGWLVARVLLATDSAQAGRGPQWPIQLAAISAHPAAMVGSRKASRPDRQCLRARTRARRHVELIDPRAAPAASGMIELQLPRRQPSKRLSSWQDRIHRSLNKDAPFDWAIERVGAITSRPVLGGLHHQYCRI
jgi:hypothetical protein